MNTHSYANENPLYYIDPLGLKGKIPIVSDSITVATMIFCLHMENKAKEESKKWHDKIWGIYEERIAINEDNYWKTIDNHCNVIRNSCAEKDACYDLARESLNEANERAWEMLDSRLEGGNPWKDPVPEVCSSLEEPIIIRPDYP